jgi:hypothetical protein
VALKVVVLRTLSVAALVWLTASLTCAQSPAKPVVQQSITVTADRGLAGINDSATSVAVLSKQQMQAAPTLVLDDRLHSVAGFQLFRRTSSWTANPTTEGLSLRGLGSTAASRTLVVSDQVPLNDPFGGWVHWDEIPALAVSRCRCCAAARPTSTAPAPSAAWWTSRPSRHRSRNAPLSPPTPRARRRTPPAKTLCCNCSRAATQHLGAFSRPHHRRLHPTAPACAGPWTSLQRHCREAAASNSARCPQSLRLRRTFLRGNVFNESRSNGTPTRPTPRACGATSAAPTTTTLRPRTRLRLYGSRESYRQSFSSIAANRNSETLTKLQHVPLDEFGFVLQASRALPQNVTAALGIDLRDIRATDDETASPTLITSPPAPAPASARPAATPTPYGSRSTGRSPAPFASTPSAPSRAADGSPTAQRSRNFRSSTSSSRARASAWSVSCPHGLALTATAFRAFRGPT